MDLARLRRRGWSEGEISRAVATLERAEAAAHPSLRGIERMAFWLLLVALGMGAIAIALELLPLILLTPLAITLPIALILGACLGMLLVHMLRDMRLERAHQHAGVAALLAFCTIALTLVIGTVASRIGLGDGPARAALPLAAALCAGILAPYVAHHWRESHGSS